MTLSHSALNWQRVSLVVTASGSVLVVLSQHHYPSDFAALTSKYKVRRNNIAVTIAASTKMSIMEPCGIAMNAKYFYVIMARMTIAFTSTTSVMYHQPLRYSSH